VRKILDTNRLINHWRSFLKDKSPNVSGTDIKQGANKLIKAVGSNAIVTPVYLEFIAGSRSKEELQLFLIFLAEFEIVDKGVITPDDWKIAKQIASRVPRDGHPRDSIDCLIAAIAERLHMVVDTADRRFAR
jgi:predicted nucleic acid-binding protein